MRLVVVVIMKVCVISATVTVPTCCGEDQDLTSRRTSKNVTGGARDFHCVPRWTGFNWQIPSAWLPDSVESGRENLEILPSRLVSIAKLCKLKNRRLTRVTLNSTTLQMPTANESVRLEVAGKHHRVTSQFCVGRMGRSLKNVALICKQDKPKMQAVRLMTGGRKASMEYWIAYNALDTLYGAILFLQFLVAVLLLLTFTHQNIHGKLVATILMCRLTGLTLFLVVTPYLTFGWGEVSCYTIG